MEGADKPLVGDGEPGGGLSGGQRALGDQLTLGDAALQKETCGLVWRGSGVRQKVGPQF